VDAAANETLTRPERQSYTARTHGLAHRVHRVVDRLVFGGPHHGGPVDYRGEGIFSVAEVRRIYGVRHRRIVIVATSDTAP